VSAQWWRALSLAALGLALAVAGPVGSAWAASSYLVVFVDGRTLEVTAARLLDERHLRLELGEGAAVTVPLLRVERVIEAEVEEEAQELTVPSCPTGFVAEELPQGVPFAGEIVRASRATNLHPWLVAAVVEAESAFDPWAVSRVGARGLMQLMPAVWVEQGVVNPHDVRANLQAGCRHLQGLLQRYGNLALALAAYNAGAGAVDRAAGVPPYRETREFLRRVLSKFCPGGVPPEVAKAAREDGPGSGG
jgi:soluble lytic murein transglycosylase-like protein